MNYCASPAHLGMKFPFFLRVFFLRTSCLKCVFTLSLVSLTVLLHVMVSETVFPYVKDSFCVMKSRVPHSSFPVYKGWLYFKIA